MDFPADRTGFYVSAAACLPVSASVFAGHACLNGADRAAGWGLAREAFSLRACP